MRTYTGFTQRTTNGRFLYGRTSNYRLNSCLMSLINYSRTIGSDAPTSGASPLSVTISVHAETPNSLTPGIQSHWPSDGSGMSIPNEAGGIVVQNSGYARISSPPAITVVKTVQFGDGSGDTNVAFGSDTVHSYHPAGSYTPDLVCTDSLHRVNKQILDTVVVS